MSNKETKTKDDPGTAMKALMDAVMLAYNDTAGATAHPSLRQMAEEWDLNPLQVRKLLITVGVYHSDTADDVWELHCENKTVEEIMAKTGLSKASVYSYLPYVESSHRQKEILMMAEKCRMFRERRAAVERMKQCEDVSTLWNTLMLFQSHSFYTMRGLKFSYSIRGGEMFVNRKDKSITRATVELAFQKALSMDRTVSGPKKLGVFGASYLYPIFIRIGVIQPQLVHGQTGRA